MSKRPARPANTPWLMPYLVVKDAEAALDFYQRAFGFEKRLAIPGPDGRPVHVEVAHRDAVLMFGPEGSCQVKTPLTTGTPTPVGLYVYCDDVDGLFARATAAGAKVVKGPEDRFWGDRVCELSDPDGYSWSFATNVRDFDPSQVPH
jgi:uncharacterized glyoxalase superfamily protein PhnB